jgi:hypothetical protein
VGNERLIPLVLTIGLTLVQSAYFLLPTPAIGTIESQLDLSSFPTPVSGSRASSSEPVSTSSWSSCATEGSICAFSGTKEVRYGANNRYVVKKLSDGTPCTNKIFGDPIVGVVKSCEISDSADPSPSPDPLPPTGQGLNFTADQFAQAISFDFEGENGVPQSGGASIGYPCGVPNNYSWKFGTTGTIDISQAIQGRGPQLAGAGYNQVYNACGSAGRPSVPNARVEFTPMIVQAFIDGRWTQVVSQAHGGAAFAEDFVNNQATGADIRDEGNGHSSVRSGIGNAAGGAGSSTGRSAQDGPVGYNFHGFPDRFAIDWSKAKAIVVSQAMRCVGSDCTENGYIANVGLDSWATTSSNFDGFKSHGGVSGGRFKPVTAGWQIYTNFVGDYRSIPTPPVPTY